MRTYLLLAMLIPGIAFAGDLGPRDGWRILSTGLSFSNLLERLLQAVPEQGMGVVTQAGPTVAHQGTRRPAVTSPTPTARTAVVAPNAAVLNNQPPPPTGGIRPDR